MKANKCKQKENAGSTMAFDFIGPPLDASYTPGNRTRFSIPPVYHSHGVCLLFMSYLCRSWPTVFKNRNQI